MWKGIPLGYITIVSGTPQRVSATSVFCHAILVQQVVGNIKPIFVLDQAAGSYTTGVGVCAAIPAPSYDAAGEAVVLPHASGSITVVQNALDLKNFWVDGMNSGDKVMVSYLQL